jgi:hypothetical protein
MSEVHHDDKGFPIHEGDIIQCFHFIGRRKRKHFMYKIVSHDATTGTWWAHDITELFQKGLDSGHKCRLQAVCGVDGPGCEIIHGLDQNPGFLPTFWYERHKK